MSLAYLFVEKETVSDLAAAAEERYREGLELLRGGESYGAIYLLGYAAELTLKVAIYRFSGLRPTDTGASVWGAARAFAKTIGWTEADMGHSLAFWAHYLVRRRQIAGRPLRADVEIELLGAVDYVRARWSVEMRYLPANAPRYANRSWDPEARTFAENVSWLRRNAAALVV